MAKEKRKLDKAIPLILGIVAAILAIVAVVILVWRFWPRKNPDYSKYKNDVSSGDNQSGSKDGELPANPIKFKLLQAENEDVCAWIELKGAEIDHPIARAGENKDDEYYLRRDLDEKYSVGGTVFIQKMNSADFSDRCTIVYGHNMTNLTMFGRLKYFRDKDFFDKNEYFYIYTPKHILKYAIKSAFVYDDRHIYYSFNRFATDTDFENFVKEVCNPKSLVKNVRESVEINNDSKLVVLSTCTNIDSERYLVVGVLVEDTKTK